MNSFNPAPEQLQKIARYSAPILTYILAAMTATWWVDNDPLRGLVFGAGLLAFFYSFGVNDVKAKGIGRVYFVLVYVVPVLVSLAVGLYGFF